MVYYSCESLKVLHARPSEEGGKRKMPVQHYHPTLYSDLGAPYVPVVTSAPVAPPPPNHVVDHSVSPVIILLFKVFLALVVLLIVVFTIKKLTADDDED